VVNIKYLLAVLLLVVLGVLAAVYLAGSEEKKVKGQFRHLSELVAKGSGENMFTAAGKVKKIAALFANACELHVSAHSLSGRYTPEEISGHALQARAQFSTLALDFYDLDLSFPEREIARVHCTARLTGRSTTAERVDEIRELDCLLKKVQKEWLFTKIDVVEVLKR
jgi:hypothetical protein